MLSGNVYQEHLLLYKMLSRLCYVNTCDTEVSSAFFFFSFEKKHQGITVLPIYCECIHYVTLSVWEGQTYMYSSITV